MRRALCILLAVIFAAAMALPIYAQVPQTVQTSEYSQPSDASQNFEQSEAEPHLRQNTLWDKISIVLIFAFCILVTVLLIRYGKKWLHR